jgi:hypothetical protein
MMYPRLFLARDLLRDDGVIFVSIDDNELHHLRLLLNELFGEACFKNCVILRRGIKSVQAQFDTLDALAVGHEYVLIYARHGETRLNKLHVPRDEAKPGTWNNHWRGTDRPTLRYELFGITPAHGQWRWSRARSLQAVANYERLLTEVNTGAPSQEQIDAWYARQADHLDLLRLSRTGKPEHYVPPSETRLGSDLWTDLSPRGSTDLQALFGDGAKVFDNPKPVALVRRMLSFATRAHESDLVLDFFAGSGTTAQAVLEANAEDGGNRRFLLVQRPETLPADAGARRFGCETIADLTRERVRRVLAANQQQHVQQRRLPRLSARRRARRRTTRPFLTAALARPLIVTPGIGGGRQGRQNQALNEQVRAAPVAAFGVVSHGGFGYVQRERAVTGQRGKGRVPARRLENRGRQDDAQPRWGGGSNGAPARRLPRRQKQRQGSARRVPATHAAFQTRLAGGGRRGAAVQNGSGRGDAAGRLERGKRVDQFVARREQLEMKVRAAGNAAVAHIAQ